MKEKTISIQGLNVEQIRKDFPVLNRKINGKDLVYLDNGATSQKPNIVIDAVSRFYKEYNANVHRGIYKLSEESTLEYEGSRNKIAKFLNARYTEEIIFTRNATEALNLISNSYGNNLSKDDEILLTVMEHHSNIVPWQLLKKRKGVNLKFVDIDENGFLKTDDYDKLLNKKTKIVSLTQMSNVLGTINPIKELIKKAHKNKSIVIVDACQSIVHMKVDVKELNADFLVFSGHKLFGPSGIGVLYGKKELLEKMDPFLGGGDMIKEVHLDRAEWNDLPWKFEAGTPNIAGAIGLGYAIDYINKIEYKNIEDYEKNLTKYALEKLSNIKGIEIYGPKNYMERGSIITFNIKGVHPHDVASILDSESIAIRSGHHCAQPLMERLKVDATNRISLCFYNTKEEIDKTINALQKVVEVFGK
mgnify:CR=1 FL=1